MNPAIFFQTIPIDVSITQENQIVAFDDVVEIVETL